MKSKKCFKCGIEKPLEEFYKHSEMADGHLNKCKTCTKKDSQEQYNIRMKSVDFILSERERNRERAKRLNYNDKYKPDPEQKKAQTQRYWDKNREKRKAHIIVGNAIKSGILIKQPCQVCQATENIEAHHEDYSKPLEVDWYCVKHHNERHVQLREEKLLQLNQVSEG
ncbi:MAG TPA: hypothetical protein VHO03_16655 [Ignavibacteriales bacterium]|nr:hypothetical protein [Ignavibacteriales bacterium]